MAIRTTLDIPEALHSELRQRAIASGTSMRALILSALQETYGARRKGKKVTGPMIRVKGKLGPRFPVDETPYDLLLP